MDRTTLQEKLLAGDRDLKLARYQCIIIFMPPPPAGRPVQSTGKS
jgi:hypothetical protein